MLGKIALRDSFSQRTARLRSPVLKPLLLLHDVLPTVGFDAFQRRVNSFWNDDKAEPYFWNDGKNELTN